MDPLTGFGLAASVVQFVTFTGGLLKKSIEIHNSASGLPNTLDIHDTYQELTRLSLDLSLRDSTNVGYDADKIDREIQKDMESVKELARICASDCDTLLNVVGKLRVEDGRGRRIKSLRSAFMALRKDGEIKHLEKRLAETERQITLYLCHISNYCHTRHTQALKDLQEKAYTLALDQHARFNFISSSLDEIKTMITAQFQQHTMRSSRPPQVADIQVVRDLMAKVTLSERDMVREQEVLSSLSYEHRLDRYRSISSAHKKTFSWVFDPANSSSEGFRLVRWLRQGRGVFWITGKPGSGKSTMMKFLCDDAKTITALQEWAGEKELSIVSHYFWLSGTMMQKSQEGLFRSLLYGIFQRCPELIQKACFARWEAAGRVTGIENRQPPWTVDELLTAISSLHGISELPVKFCIFIDGLDEYRGDHLEMCNTIHELAAASQDLKLCVASRPWNDFENAFGGGQQLLKMHQLTRDDILTYTHDRLTEHWAWTTVAANTCLADSLINLILRHAEGVFLWVVLVTKEIREGLSNCDSLEELYRRVEGFPSDLGEFFKLILESIDPFYHAKMSTALQLCLTAERPLELPIYYFHEREYADPDYALKLPILQPAEDVVEERCKIMEKRLNGWTKGLLEVQKQNGLDVQFLHRTVRDFLDTPEMAALLKAKAPAHFSACLSIVKAYTAWMKSRPLYDKPEKTNHVHAHQSQDMPNQYEAPFHWMTTGLLSAARGIWHKQDYVSSQIQTEAFKHLDEFERSAVELENRGQIRFEFHEDVKYAASLFVENVFRHDLVFYLSHKVSNEPDYLNLFDMNRYILKFMLTQRPSSSFAGLRKALHALRSRENQNKGANEGLRCSGLFATIMSGWEDDHEKTYWAKQLIRMRFVSLVLEFGANPNDAVNYDGLNPCRLMIAIPLEVESGGYDGDTYLLELDSLLGHGADSEAKMEGQRRCVSDTPISAREWFFKEIQQPLGRNLNEGIIGEVAVRLLRRIEDEAEADAAWGTLKEALPPVIYERLNGVVAGGKRKRDEDHQQLGKRVTRPTRSYFGPQEKLWCWE